MAFGLSFRQLPRVSKRMSLQTGGFVLGIAVIGTIATLAIRAASPTVSVEPENGTLSGSVSTINDSTASNGKAIQFGSSTTPSELTAADIQNLRRWAGTTYASIEAMTDPNTGLAADLINANLSASSRSRNTSPTNIGLQMWSAVVAARLGLITQTEATTRVNKTLDTLAAMDRHTPSGMFYNWYDITNGQVLTKWPGSNDTVYPFLSSVDNAWMAAALKVVGNGIPSLKTKAMALYDSMHFTAFYNPDTFGGSRPGLFYGGFWAAQPGGGQASQQGTVNGSTVWFTTNSYDLVGTETRILSYVAIPKGEVPAAQYFSLKRTFSAGKGYSWTEQQPTGVSKIYMGTNVYEGTFAYRGMQIMPTWGGSMFEELMPDLVVPETAWGPNSWAINHPLAVQAQIQHGMNEAGYGYWGFSPASDPFGSYREYGVDEIGINDKGYYSDKEQTNVDKGYGTFRTGNNPNPTFGDGVVTPHASFLALPYAPRAAVDNLKRIETNLGAYGAGGFYDAIAVKSNTKAARYLSLDQGMIMGALGNVLDDGLLHRLYGDTTVQNALQPVLSMEEFGSKPAP